MPATVLIPMSGRSAQRLCVSKIHSIESNRLKGSVEQYLVRWNTADNSRKPPLSWHAVTELGRCLEHVQDYLEVRPELRKSQSLPVSRKRKSPDTGVDVERRASPFHRVHEQDDRASSNSPSPSTSSMSAASSAALIDVYNGVLDLDEHGFVFCRSASSPDIPELDIRQVSTGDMLLASQRGKVDNANIIIRAEYSRRLEKVPGKKLHLNNIHDMTTPSLRFRYIPEYILHKGVYKADAATQEGCQQCSPHMGRDIGCEYTKKCSCLEYAAVDETRMDAAMMADYQDAVATGGSTLGFPKKFPYFAECTKIQRAGCLVPFYLHSRRPIYECNDACRCGPHCRNKNVQFGRTVELEIFRTDSGRGWGLRCKENLYMGQFVDTYRGEVITDAEATRRENTSTSKNKASYLYSLDKFAESEGIEQEDLYVVDGEFMGGPTKFMNHSCEPNCRQYTVSYNKHDPRVYDLAFFTSRDIPAGEELTFDYLDKEEGEEIEDPGEDAIPCLCGAAKCRKWLWT